MKKYRVVKIRCKTLEQVFEHIIVANSLEEAREIGEVRYGASGYFVGAERILEP